MVTASADNTARVWDAQTGQPLTEPLKHADQVGSAQFSPDGKRVVTASRRQYRAGLGCADRPAADRAFATRARGCFRRIQPGRQARRHRFDGQYGAGVGRADRPATDRTFATRRRGLVRPIQPGRPARSSPLQHDNTARVWDAQTGPPLNEPLQHGACGDSAQFSPDGRRVVTASDDNTARVWDAQTGQPLTAALET